MKNRISTVHLSKAANKKHGRIIVLTGARQTGKTTLVKHVFPDYEYISLDDPITRSDYIRLTASQWMQLYPIAILDEVQKVPGLIESIKAVYDQSDHTRYILSGSTQLLLMKQIKESLAGRCFIMELYPLTLTEMLTESWNDPVKPSVFMNCLDDHLFPNHLLPSFRLYPDFSNRMQVFNHYLKNGAYPTLSDPELIDQDKKDWLKNYIRTYLEKDIRELAGFQNFDPFVTVQKLLAIQTATLVNFSQIAKESGISLKTAQQYLRYLEMSYQVFTLLPWQKNERKRMVKSPRVHFMDPGVLNTLLNKDTITSGLEYESAIVAEIYKQIKAMEKAVNLYHLRTHDGLEIDLLLEFPDYYFAMEIKMSNNIGPNDIRHLRKLDSILNKPVRLGMVLSNDVEIKSFEKNIWAIPAALFLTG